MKCRRGVSTSTKPIFFARLPSTARPVSIKSNACPAPISFGMRLAPPHPGTMPIITSGRAIFVFGPSSIIRYLQASANSVPPPMQKPWISATVGKGNASTWSNTTLPSVVNANASSAVLSVVNSSMSAPAAKPFSFADKMARPFGRFVCKCVQTSASSRSASLEKVLVLDSARSNVSHARLSRSMSRRQCFQLLMQLAPECG